MFNRENSGAWDRSIQGSVFFAQIHADALSWEEAMVNAAVLYWRSDTALGTGITGTGTVAVGIVAAATGEVAIDGAGTVAVGIVAAATGEVAIDGTGTVAVGIVAAATGTVASGLAIDQSAFRWGENDGAPGAHTWKAAENTGISLSAGGVARLALQLAMTGDLASGVAKLQIEKNASGTWHDVTVEP